MATTTVKKSESTDVVVTTDTVETLAKEYIAKQTAIDVIDAPAKWAWAKKVSLMLECTADKSQRTAKSEELGKTVGEQLRGKAYSGSWVRLHVMAYKAFPNGLDGSNREDVRKFQTILSGNAAKFAKDKAEKEQPAKKSDDTGEQTDDEKTARDFLANIRYSIKRALAAGFSTSDIEAECSKAITDLAGKYSTK